MVAVRTSGGNALTASPMTVRTEAQACCARRSAKKALASIPEVKARS
jgi:hypothetical protein